MNILNQSLITLNVTIACIYLFILSHKVNTKLTAFFFISKHFADNICNDMQRKKFFLIIS